jgi:hypothetical protein
MTPPRALPEDMAAWSAQIADAIASAMAGQVVPMSDWLAAEHERGGLARAGLIERVLGLAASGEPVSDDDLEMIRDIGVDFARNNAPLSLLKASLDVGTVALMRESWRVIPADRVAEMAQFTEWVTQAVERGRRVALRGYLETLAESGGRPVRQVVAEALVSGECTPEAAQAMGLRLAPEYLVMACAVPDPARVGAGQVAAIRAIIDNVPGALHCGDLSALVVLLPVEGSPRPPDETGAELVAAMRALAGQPVYAAQALRPGLAGIPSAHQEACQALPLVKALPDADCQPYELEGLLVELAIARQPDIRQRLAALLAPLDAGPDLRRTLEVLLACGLDRERTAKELYIHRRTLRYRLDRIRRLSGIDPCSVHGIHLLRSALTADRLGEGGENSATASAM